MSKTVYDIDFTRILPDSLKNDETMLALGRGIADVIQRNIILARNAVIYPRIDELDENTLDILAYDFNVEWYDYEGTIDEKRRTIAECMKIHKFKGTKAAILTALKSVYDDVRVQEWFEYGGKPYHFKIFIRHSHSGYAKLARLLQKVKYYKNLRSHLEETIFEVDLTPPPVDVFVGAFDLGLQREDGARVTCDIPAVPTLKTGLSAAVWAGSEYREIGASVHYKATDFPALNAKLSVGYFLYAMSKTINLPEVSYYGLECSND